MAKTKFGKWSMWLAAASIVLIIIGTILSYVYNITVRSPLHIVVGVTADLIGISAFVLGMVAIARYKEHSFFVYMSVALGALILFGNLTVIIL